MELVILNGLEHGHALVGYQKNLLEINKRK